VTAATDGATVTDQLVIVTTEGSSLYSVSFYLLNKFTRALNLERTVVAKFATLKSRGAAM